MLEQIYDFNNYIDFIDKFISRVNYFKVKNIVSEFIDSLKKNPSFNECEFYDLKQKLGTVARDHVKKNYVKVHVLFVYSSKKPIIYTKKNPNTKKNALNKNDIIFKLIAADEKI